MYFSASVTHSHYKYPECICVLIVFSSVVGGYYKEITQLIVNQHTHVNSNVDVLLSSSI